MVNLTNVMLNSFPGYLKNDIELIINKIPFNLTTARIHTFSVTIEKEIIHIPERIYYDEPAIKDIDQFTNIQRDIINCFYSRHHNGIIREKKLRSIIKSNQPWVIPFVIKLLSEYVIEILDVININIKNIDEEKYRTFILNNKNFFATTESRIISYWNCYYRTKFHSKEDYVGFKLLNYFKFLLKDKV